MSSFYICKILMESFKGVAKVSISMIEGGKMKLIKF